MKKTALTAGLLLTPLFAAAQPLNATAGEFSGDFRLRYETHQSDQKKKDATALTLRSRIGYQSPVFAGVSLLAEAEDVAALIDEYTPQDNRYLTVADPQNREVNRAQLHYQQRQLAATLGRQRIILDNARFIGNVGWRQNEQTYDAALVRYNAADFELTYAYLDLVNDIFFGATEVDSHVIHIKNHSADAARLSAYAYWLDFDDSAVYYHSYGTSLSGDTELAGINSHYRAEIAYQSADNGDEREALYYRLEAGITLKHSRLTLGNETLGSDAGEYGFQTPLATKHAFNGWADRFLNTPDRGLSDNYLSLSYRLHSFNTLAVYHRYYSDRGHDELGGEINLKLGYNASKQFSLGIKYADFNGVAGQSDSQKFWLWSQLSF